MLTDTTVRIDQFLAFYNSLSSSNLTQLDVMYHTNVSFTDPVHSLSGRDALAQYFGHAYERLLHCEFTAAEKIEQGDQGFVSWCMQMRHPAINRGQLVSLDGCSVLRWQDEKIIYHRDYYDLTDMVYQHLPVIGWLTSKVKQRMSGAD